MKLRNLKIETQLKFGFSVMLVLVVILGGIAFIQTNQIHQKTVDFYERPLQVIKAMGNLNNDILSIRLDIRELMIARNEQEKQNFLEQIELASADAIKQFDIIEERYSGPTTDVEEAYQAFIIWGMARDENIRLVLSGEIDKVLENSRLEGSVGLVRQNLLDKLNTIDNFALKMSTSLYSSSNELHDRLNKQLLLLVATLLSLLFVISYYLLRSIQNPLKEIEGAIKRFHLGIMNSRSSYNHKNEFGALSLSFNTMADLIEVNTTIKEISTRLIDVMLSEDDARKFFRVTLSELALHTNAQVAAVYLLSDDNMTYDYFESIGMDGCLKKSFEAHSYEGEFGSVILNKTIQVIENIPKDTQFEYNTAHGKFIPSAIITIPIISNNHIIAIISIASINKFSKQAVNLINNIISTISARIEGILAYSKVKEFKEELEKQNYELDKHKSELSAQTVELIQQNTELEIQKQQLDDASRLKTNFLSNMSHELRTPLNSVIALSGVLSRRLANQISEEESSYLEIIERNGKNLLVLINDILDISRIEAGHEEIEITKFNTTTLVNEVVSMIEIQAKQKNIELIYEPSNLDLYITSDVDKCRHVLQNIIGNAVKFTEEGSVIISSQFAGDFIKIKVNDSGIGISAEHLPHIFDEFRQADGSTSRKFGGTGLGLAIAKKYANLLGGTILVKSTLDKGTEFIISLPIDGTNENRIVEMEKTNFNKHKVKKELIKPLSISTNNTILLVEDNESAIIQIKGLIQEMGYKLLIAQDAKEALEIIDHIIPDAMILDLMMPGIDGFGLLSILRNAEPTAHLPVLILTAKHVTKEELKLLRRNNIHQLIQKGDVNGIELKNAITNMLYTQEIEITKKQHKKRVIEGKPIVLVVEDNPDNMVSVRALLSDQYIVIEATNGFEGLELAREFLPNLILMDIALYGLDGIETLKSIRAIPDLQNIPIIAITASALAHERELVLSQGFDAFISKPIIEEDFFKILSEVLYE